MLLAVLIFVVTIVLVIWQPKGLGIGWSAIGGAVLALLAGVVTLSDVPVVWGIVWNATAAFVSIIVISLLLDEAGSFEWAALHVARWGRGHGRRLFVLIVLLGAAVSALFANDGAALILTPIVIAMLRALGFKDKATLAFVMAAGFIADTASLPLVVSNLVNIVSADFFKIGFGTYTSVMVPVDLVSIAATLGVLLLFFRRDLPEDYDVGALRAPREAIRDVATFRAGWIILALLLAGFFLLEPLGVPVSAVAAAGAILLLVIAGRGNVIQTGKVLRGAPWQVVIFSLGMYLVVYGRAGWLRHGAIPDYVRRDWFRRHAAVWAERPQPAPVRPRPADRNAHHQRARLIPYGSAGRLVPVAERIEPGMAIVPHHRRAGRRHDLLDLLAGSGLALGESRSRASRPLCCRIGWAGRARAVRRPRSRSLLQPGLAAPTGSEAIIFLDVVNLRLVFGADRLLQLQNLGRFLRGGLLLVDIAHEVLRLQNYWYTVSRQGLFRVSARRPAGPLRPGSAERVRGYGVRAVRRRTTLASPAADRPQVVATPPIPLPLRASLTPRCTPPLLARAPPARCQRAGPRPRR